MKKSIFLISILVCILFICGCNTEKESVEQSSDFSDELIETINKSPAISSGNLITKTATDSDGNIYIRYYDKSNNLSEEYVWNKDLIISHTVMQYNPSGTLSSKEIISSNGQSNIGYYYSYDDNDSLINTTEHTYSNALLTQSKTVDTNNKTIDYTKYTYTTTKQLKRVDYFDGSDNLLKYTVYEYSESDQIIKYSVFDSQETLQNYSTYEYNNEGKTIQTNYFDSNGKLQNYSVIEYYEDTGETKSVTTYDSNGTELTKEFY